MQRILITGASGLLGRAVMRRLSGVGRFHVTGTAFQRAGHGLVPLNLLNAASVRQILEKTQPQLIIHCAAERRPDVSEGRQAETLALNVEATATLALLAAQHASRLLYISTDYVFDGTAPPYMESASPHPLNFYGRSKFAGEQRVLESLPAHGYVLRLPILYGPVTQLNECPLMALAQALQTRAETRLDHWAIRFPTLVDDVAVVLQHMAERIFNAAFPSGIYHWQSPEAFTKYEIVRAMGRALGIAHDHLRPVTVPTDAAPRPQNCCMDCGKLRAYGVGQSTPFQSAIGELLRPFFPAVQ